MGDYYLVFSKFGDLVVGSVPNDNKITLKAYDGSLLILQGIYDGADVIPFAVTGKTGIFDNTPNVITLCVIDSMVAIDFTNGVYCS